MIKITKTYCIVTPESAENGDFAECGIYADGLEYGFRELVRELEEFCEPSCSHGVPRWASTYPGIDYESGEEETISIHPGEDRISQKYWAKAWSAANRWRQ